MPGRGLPSSTGYRYGFNGKENDNEVKGNGNSIDFGARIYDSRLGRFLSTDPLEGDYPWQSTYVFAANNPIALIDLNGEGPHDPQSLPTVNGQTGPYSNEYTASLISVGENNYVTPAPSGAEGSSTMDALPRYMRTASNRYTELREQRGDVQWNAYTDIYGNNLVSIAYNGTSVGDGAQVFQAELFFESDYPQVSAGVSMIPFVGSGQQAYNDFSDGNIGEGIFNTALMVSDVFLLKSVAINGTKTLIKGGFKGTFGIGMSHEYGATVSRWKSLGINPSGYKHHWAISQKAMQKYPSLKPFGNQMWNLKGFGSQASHMRWAHFKAYPSLGLGKIPGARFLYPISSTPGWLKAGAFSTYGHLKD